MKYPPAIICEIETPQFRPDGTIKEFYRQSGYFYVSELKFQPGPLRGHTVMFPSIENFEKYLVITDDLLKQVPELAKHDY